MAIAVGVVGAVGATGGVSGVVVLHWWRRLASAIM